MYIYNIHILAGESLGLLADSTTYMKRRVNPASGQPAAPRCHHSSTTTTAITTSTTSQSRRREHLRAGAIQISAAAAFSNLTTTFHKDRGCVLCGLTRA